ncbi:MULTISPECIES: AfsR/SARP family transcriptional regulator [Streptomyces]|uniref:AfsR/SARP family transcriptional regulator n=1 Tax=Streptomyces TaxID=1883 RepID=UPI0009A48375|nr:MULTISPECIES: AfsR/SARP family transcriptional regulator [Streptomyces]
MEVKVLGPMEAYENGVPIVPSAPKQRQILALLALQAPQAVTVPSLMEELWGEEIPRSASPTLQTYILQLRRRIGAAHSDPGIRPRDILATRFGGYLLDVPADRVDAREFERLAQAGRRAFDAGDDFTASELLRAALQLWRGPALVDVPVGRVLELELMRLEEGRMAALEQRIEADLRLGRHAGLLGELRVLAAQHPLHENLCAQLMIALYRCGAPGRALDAYGVLSDNLVESLGLNPSPRLQRLQHAVLTADPALELPDTTARYAVR